jgi:hypothetical protein
MEKINVINESNNHNSNITARPAILIPATGTENNGWVIQMGKTGPRVLVPPLPQYIEWDLEPFQSVRVFTSAFMRLGSPERAEMEAGASKKDRETYDGLLRLRATHATLPFPLDEKAAKRELSKAGTKLIEDPRIQATFAGGQVRKVAAWFFPAFFNRELKQARVVLWLTKQNQFVPAIFCPDMKTAMFAFAAFGHIVACPNCGELFAVDAERPDKSRAEKYCTVACGSAYRQKAYRARLKAKVKRKKGILKRVRPLKVR